VRFLIDECLTPERVAVANDRGHGAQHVAHLQMPGTKDWDVASHAWKNEYVMVTNNRADYRALYERRELHSGLVVVIPNVRRERQRQFFSAALDYLDEAGEPINQVLEIDSRMMRS
jgi:predicted nuclease of predicted toxin-antitoxin system